jgi:phosphoribosylformylglycinamidine synthase
MIMLVLRGTPAFTPARLAKRLKRIQSTNPAIREITASFVHFAEVTRPLAEEEARVLDRLLHYGPRVEARDLAGRRLLIVPRVGTISPWSSKATDVAHNCGLDQVRRIERGIWYTLAGEVASEPALHAAIHDRMTESVLEREADAEKLFHHATPRPLDTVDARPSRRPTAPWAWPSCPTRSTTWSRASVPSAATRPTSS